MRLLARIAVLGSILLTAACGLPPGSAADAARLANLRYRALLVAGDGGVAAFDNATDAMRARLTAARAVGVRQLTSSAKVSERGGAGIASLDEVLSAIHDLRPEAGQGCLVFVTSHGSYRQGLVLMPSRNFLTPSALDAALTAGCGDRPAIAILSGCFSGAFARGPMARANRIVLTAARDDRPSFGCGAGFRYTFYDRCLLEAMDRAITWRDAHGQIRTCVATRELALGFKPSEPQAWFGEGVSGMPVPR